MRNKCFLDQPVLIVDDDEFHLRHLQFMLKEIGISNTILCTDSRQVHRILAQQPVSFILLDLVMPYISGDELLIALRHHFPKIPIVVITGTEKVDTAVRCIKLGAFNYIVKPLDIQQLLEVTQKASQMRDMANGGGVASEQLREAKLDNPDAFRGIVTNSEEMLSIFRYVELIAPSSESVLVTGETGVGKELLVRAIHDVSQLPGSFVAINVAGIDDHMFTDTLFGHARGAFTGAGQERKGMIEQTRDGTLFLDEIGDLSATSQAKLLRMLQDGDYIPLGQDQVRHSNARIISATNCDLWELTKEGQFREDLNFRLRTHHIHIPPLREHREDLPLLIGHFISQAAALLNRDAPVIPNELLELLEYYPFPGNIRELRAMMFNALSITQGKTLSLQSLHQHLARNRKQSSGNLPGQDLVGSQLTASDDLPTLKEATDMLIKEALKRANGNQTLAGRILGISQQAVSKRLKNMQSEQTGEDVLYRNSNNERTCSKPHNGMRFLLSERT